MLFLTILKQAMSSRELAVPEKIRFEYEGRGKSGSTRVIYVDFEIGEKICGLAAYAKADKDNLTQGERNAIRKLIQLIEPYYNKPSGKKEP